MHPAALSMASDVMCQHTGRVVELLEHHAHLSHGRELAKMLQQVIKGGNEITKQHMESILLLTQQNHAALNKNLDHYIQEQKEFNRKHRDTTDVLLRAEMTSHAANIDDQMKTVRRDMEALHQFSVQMLAMCAEAGLSFTKDMSVPYTAPQIIG